MEVLDRGAIIEFPKNTKTITIEKMSRISGPGIHADDEVAKELGLRGAIAQGGQLSGYLTEMMARVFGRQFLYSGEIAVSFIHPVRPGDVVSSHGRVTNVSEVEGKRRIECEIWLENQRGQKVTVGTASGLLP
jgi:acyl dehydratase